MFFDPVAATFRDAVQQLAVNKSVPAGAGDIDVECINDAPDFPGGDFAAEMIA
jgi:hypothetical protein